MAVFTKELVKVSAGHYKIRLVSVDKHCLVPENHGVLFDTNNMALDRDLVIAVLGAPISNTATAEQR